MTCDRSLLKISWSVVAVALLLMAYLLFNQLWVKAALTGIVIIPALVFMIRERRKIPHRFLTVYVFVTFFNVICMGWELYNRIPHMDELAHFLTSFALVPCLSFALLGSLEGLNTRLFVLLGFCLGISVGAGWEVLEFVLKVEAGYVDTITDLIFDMLGCALAALWAAVVRMKLVTN